MSGSLPRLLPLWLFLACACSPLPAPGGNDPDSLFAVLNITSEPAGLRVFSDTLFLGTTPFESAPLPVGMFRFRILGGDAGRWASPSVSDSVMLLAGDTVARHVVFPRFVRVTSEPAGAEVRMGDSSLGATPLFALLPVGSVSLTLSRPLYVEQQVFLAEGLGRCHVVMTPVDPLAGGYKPLSGGVSDNSTPVILAVSVAVVSGATSAYLKTRADSRYDDYRASGDRRTLDQVRRYDLFSGIALGVTELSIGYLIMKLLSR